MTAPKVNGAMLVLIAKEHALATALQTTADALTRTFRPETDEYRALVVSAKSLDVSLGDLAARWRALKFAARD